MRKFNKLKEIKNDRDDGIIRQELSNSSSMFKNIKGNMNIMRMEQNIF